MKVNKNAFFREATLRICGSLDVGNFLFQSFSYVRDFIPADAAFLTHFDPDAGKHLALARASSEGASLLNLSVSMPPDVRSFVERRDLETLPIDRAEMHPTASPWIAKGLLDKKAALLVLRLVLEGQIVGAVVFVAGQSGAFTQEHAGLLSLLREPFAIALSNSLRYQELVKLKELLDEDNRFLRTELRQAAGEDVIGADFGLKGVMEMVRQVASLSSPVLLLGETGAGKEVIAGAIHSLSQRKDGPFIKINCGAIPENLMDSELFGHEKGAFTGALSQKRGRFERAEGGTVFLDEVGELRPEAQVRLLRVLQDKEIERVGGTEPIKVDIRVIAATHRDLESMIEEGTFREDLYFRLKVFPVAIPPLRERKGDLPSLVHHFMQKKTRDMGLRRIPTLAPGALDAITAYSWPGNVRELENAVERAIILSKGGPISFEHMRAATSGQARAEDERMGYPPKKEIPSGESLALDETVSRHIRRVLDMTGGKVGGKGGAAQMLQVNPSTLRKKMRKLGIPFGRKSR